MQVTNVGHTNTNLEYYKFINIRARLRTNSCAHARVCELGGNIL